ncbi:DUF599 domain-containing protein [Ideonella sp. DXS29W]|uniref:DUF599 domain-containing protein n=1 Tax=Ideonella lacteola TaxID=2984193 RepID=A0ABU9BJ38_9BURK
MRLTLDALSVLPLIDWLAVIGFFTAWIGYAQFARRHGQKYPSVLAATNQVRRQWMRQTTARENRVVDGVTVQNLSTSPSFFASTTILIIGGLLAVLGTTDKANDFVREIPFAARTSVLVFDLKVAMLTAIFVYAFFRFTWSMRQYTFGALLVASAPEFDAPWTDEERDAFAQRAGGVMGLAAETFNDGLRAYYMAFAAIAWFFSPLACMAATAMVIFVLYQREFHSEVLALLTGQKPV